MPGSLTSKEGGEEKKKRENQIESAMMTEFRKIEGKHRRGEGKESHTSHVTEREKSQTQ